MGDTDWRPSICPTCGEWREAAEHPLCRNPNCIECVPVDKPTMAGIKRVQAFETSDGVTHSSFEKAVAHEVSHLLNKQIDADLITMHGEIKIEVLSTWLANHAPLRSGLIRLLSQLS